MSEKIVLEKSYKFALRIEFHKYMTEMRKESVLSKQMLYSGTNVGAASAAQEADSKAGFFHEMKPRRCKTRQSEFWAGSF